MDRFHAARKKKQLELTYSKTLTLVCIIAVWPSAMAPPKWTAGPTPSDVFSSCFVFSLVGVVFPHQFGNFFFFLFALPKSKQENELKRNGRRVLFIVTDAPATFLFFHRLNGDHHRAIFLTREFISHFYRFSFSN